MGVYWICRVSSGLIVFGLCLVWFMFKMEFPEMTVNLCKQGTLSPESKSSITLHACFSLPKLPKLQNMRNLNIPIASIVVPFLGLTNSILRIL